MEENISAIATPSGKGGVAIIRISGKTALALAEKMFTPTGKTKVADFEPYRMYTGKIDGGNFTDFGLCVYFKAPASYTGEDVVEFHCHGGETIAQKSVYTRFSEAKLDGFTYECKCAVDGYFYFDLDYVDKRGEWLYFSAMLMDEYGNAAYCEFTDNPDEKQRIDVAGTKLLNKCDVY